MPNGVFPVPRFSPSQTRRPGLSLRFRTFCNRDRLDRALARGIEPATGDDLRLRAGQLVGRRAELAAIFEGLIDRAQKPYAFTAEVPIRRADVLACADDLRALARRLRDDARHDVQGVAMASNLLHDGSSPLYLDSGVTLRHAVRAARLALDPIAVPAHDLATAA
ncbi:MAG: hypothetical protein QOE60_705 [Thermoleophilaceae bacterium]|nr:hypothetical protein [Thermoleophilaceae bacterium]